MPIFDVFGQKYNHAFGMIEPKPHKVTFYFEEQED